MSYARKLLLLLGDTGMFLLASVGMLSLRFGYPIRQNVFEAHKLALFFYFILTVLLLYIFNLYDTRYARPSTQTVRNIILGLLSSLIGGFLLFYLIPTSVSPKTNLFILVGFFGIGFFLWRILFFRIFSNKFKTPLAIVGDSPLAKTLTEELALHPHVGFSVLGSFTTVQQALQMLPRGGVLVYEQHLSADDLVLVAQTHTRVLNIRDAYQTILYKIPLELVDDTLALSILEYKENSLHFIFRRLLEIVCASILIIITFPITLITSIAILLEDGSPIFYKQLRVGKRKQNFYIYKFRSMKVMNADGGAETNGAVWASSNDPRVTRVGTLIRKLHIDEIPQMINIIRGDIALVGPRPERPTFVSSLENDLPYYFLRHTITPGFTGWAQIMFRYARTTLDAKEKYEYDLYYIYNRSLFIDIGILLKTIQIIFTH